MTLTSLVGSMTAQAPAGWKIVKDVRNSCQASVPADWTYQIGTAYSPDKHISATIHGLRASQTFDMGKTAAQAAMKPTKVVQDDAKRLFYAGDPGSTAPGKQGWYAVLNSTPVCTTSLLFDKGSDEATMKKIVDSLGPAK